MHKAAMLTSQQIDEIRRELESCANPLFFYHDDADGLSSYLLLYRYCKEGQGVQVKSTPQVTTGYLPKVAEFAPDKIFILDVALVDQEFIDAVKVPIVWIDHHPPLKRHGLKYYNTRLGDPPDSLPVTCLCYQVVQQDLWIAVIGAIGDWCLPPYAAEFTSEHPLLLNSTIKNADDALFNSPVGVLVDVFSFILKGPTTDVKKNIKLLSKVKSPEEILEQQTEAGEKLYKKYEAVKKEFDMLLARAEQNMVNGKAISYIYQHDSSSFTKNIANILLYKHPDKVIIIGREKEGMLNISLRSRQFSLLPILSKALEGIEGSGGGHEFTCGAHIRKIDYEKFLKRIEEALP